MSDHDGFVTVGRHRKTNKKYLERHIVSENEQFQPDIETFWPDIVRCPMTISGPGSIEMVAVSTY